jgi:hypothetical protein
VRRERRDLGLPAPQRRPIVSRHTSVAHTCPSASTHGPARWPSIRSRDRAQAAPPRPRGIFSFPELAAEQDAPSPLWAFLGLPGPSTDQRALRRNSDPGSGLLLKAESVERIPASRSTVRRIIGAGAIVDRFMGSSQTPTSWRGKAPDLLEGTSRRTLARESTRVDRDTRVLD